MSVNDITGLDILSPNKPNISWSSAGDPAFSSPEYQTKVDDPFTNRVSDIKIAKLKDTSTGLYGSSSNETGNTLNTQKTILAAKGISSFAQGTSQLMNGVSGIYNGYISAISADMKANTYNFQANQNERMAQLLLDNQKDVTRAAQIDSNQYRMQGAKAKSEQRIAMAASGFKVGSGVYQNTFNTTEARVNYNVSQIMLKSALQNAELTRKAGDYKAQAIINKADADIARAEGEVAKRNGWISGISNFISAGASFFSGAVSWGAMSNINTGTIE